ncbi:MAG: MBOAT family protein [Lachnospiraceae bacterium]|nr:MBOAT family protein [Lachnospiraceae bacterium]
MIFNSYSFVFIFLPVTVTVYHLINRTGRELPGKLFLLASSLLFYALGDLKALAILTVSIVANYLIHLKLTSENTGPRAGKAFLILGLVLNLSNLIVFKYLGFFSGILNSVFRLKLEPVSLFLPLGISFYTFSQIAFLADSHKNPSVRYEFTDYALFVSFFPKIMMGPIALAGDMIPQFNDKLRKKADPDKIARGLVIFSAGLAKKVLLADNLAGYVTWGYSNIDKLGSINALIVMLSYTLQIYFDFSGFCDMAKAVCLMLGLDLPDNFLSPYRSASVAEFWDRWHITLTAFFTRYLYIPLGGSRKGKVRTYVNTFIVFFLSGLWHGADFTFIIWGLIHGAGVSVCRLLKDKGPKLPRPVSCAGTFLFVNIAWVFFRSETLTDAVNFLKQLFSFKLLPVNIELIAAATPDELQLLQWLILTQRDKVPYVSGCIIIIAFVLIAAFISIYCKNAAERLASLKLNARSAATTVILLVVSILSLSGVTEYIYTNF